MIATVLVVAALAAPDFAAVEASYRNVLAALVAADTTNPPGNEARAVSIIAARLKKEGIAFEITDFGPNRKNLVARLAGSGSEKPVLLLAHTDVVGTEGQRWSTPPHTMTEVGGYLQGRGVRDDLSMVAANLETIVMLKRTGVKLRRDVIVAFTGDEESGGLGVRTLLEQKPELAQVGLVINEGAWPVLREVGAQPSFVAYEAAQKTYQDFKISTSGATGHASVPRDDNAIYKLARALARLQGAEPPARLIPATRAYFKARAALETPQIAAAMNAIADAGENLPRDAVKLIEKTPLFAALMRTTCVPTLLSAGSKVNSLAASAEASLNCRILPDETIAATEERLRAIIADPAVTVERIGDVQHGPPSDLEGELLTALTTVVGDLYPGVPVMPVFATGMTDSRFFRQKGVPAYGFTPFAVTDQDVVRAHGIDERVHVSSIRPGLELYWKLILELCQSK